MNRRDFLRTWFVYSVLLSAMLMALYAVGRWLQPGVGPSWFDGLVQGVLGPPVSLAALTLRGRCTRRERTTGE